ncbi:uncharacterized protein LOC130902958 [Diorhabda carinulata]|uniref:uncharacterized protein LOC130902958 n=1 Tax=Diorhabda carinulata TaxID=1163345 RepID=UPI0025A11062|nr:uncharacterized protein LOC130902958 [Diorhabda carinulata]
MEFEEEENILDAKKKRTPNFVLAERLHLMEIISKKYGTILEDKKTDRTSVEDRTKVWRKVENNFNATSTWGIFRDKESLKRLYENRKREVRRLKAKESQLRLRTGGGPETKIKIDPADELLLSIMNKKSVEGLTNNFDCDNTFLKTTSQQATEPTAEFNVAKGVMVSDIEDDMVWVVPEDNQTTAYEFETEKYVESCKTERNYDICDQEPSTSTSSKSIDNAEEPNWKKGTDLQKPKDQALVPPHLRGKKRKKAVETTQPKRQGVKILSSSNIAKKYDILLDRRAILVDKQIEQINEELHFQKIKNKLEIEILKLKVEKKKKEQISV